MTDSNSDSPAVETEVFLIIADAWQDEDSEPSNIHILIKTTPEEDLINSALQILANEGFVEAAINEIGTLTEVPEEEPYLSAWHTAQTGNVAMIEFSGEDEDEDEQLN